MSGAVVFGKLPAHGDFVSRGLPAAERERIDDWLTRSLERAQTAYGDSYAARFDRALPWRCDGPALAGAIAASQDAAGRRFPIMVLADTARTPAECEDLLYAAIADRWPADRLADAAGSAPSGTPQAWSCPDLDRVVEGSFPDELMTAMLAEDPAG